MELISVIVPIYKVEEYLPRCIDSILAQTYTNLEVILVDDGSPDYCGVICDEYANKDDRIKVIHKVNGGLSDARNVGIEAATGDLLAFVDGDDYIASDMYEQLRNALVQNNADMAICNFKYVGQGQYDNENSPIKAGCLTGMEIATCKMLEEKYWYWVVAWNKLYKRELFCEIRYPKGKIHEDEFVIHELLHKSMNVACVDKMLYYYWQRDNSIMGKMDVLRHLDAVEALWARICYYLQINVPNNVVFDTWNRALGILYEMFEEETSKCLDYKQRYQQLHREYRRLVPKLFVKANMKEKVRLLINWISPYWWWKLRCKAKI